MNKAVVLMRKAPYGSVYAAEGFRSVMGIGIFEMDVALVFAEDGVYVLVKEQNPEKLDMKPYDLMVRQHKDLGQSAYDLRGDAA